MEEHKNTYYENTKQRVIQVLKDIIESNLTIAASPIKVGDGEANTLNGLKARDLAVDSATKSLEKIKELETQKKEEKGAESEAEEKKTEAQSRENKSCSPESEHWQKVTENS